MMEENMLVIRDPKTFYFNFDWPKDVDENLKHEFEFIINSNESLSENKIQNKTEKLSSKYNHENNSCLYLDDNVYIIHVYFF